MFVMKHIKILLNKMRNTNNRRPLDYILVFISIFIIMMAFDILIENYNHIFFQCALLSTGFFAWTFFEYMTHRYLMHTKNKEKSKIDLNHKYHHLHSTEIKLSGIQRCILCFAGIMLLFITIWMDNYFTLITGFLFGLPAYAIMHFFLHQNLTQKIIYKHVQYHIYHHCKYPDKCIGITVTWWDDLFGSVPVRPSKIPQRIIDFYFGNENDKIESLYTANESVNWP